MPCRWAASYHWLCDSLFSTTVQRGDIVQLSGALALVHYGPDLQGDVQLILDDIYPEFFPLSGDINIKDSRLKWSRSLTVGIMMCTATGIAASIALGVVAVRIALVSTEPLKTNVLFKGCIFGAVVSFAIALALLMMKASDPERKQSFFRMLQVGPVILLCASFAFWGAEEMDLHCKQEHWGPMIPQIAQLYAPHGMDRQDVSEYTQLVLFNPVLSAPTVVLPSMEHSLAPSDLRERAKYFMSEILLLMGLTCIVLEGLRFVSAKAKSCTAPNKGQFNLLEVTDSEAQVPVQQDPEAAAIPRSTLYMGFFLLWYIGFQSLLYIEMDYMVMIGAVNLTTGPAWEFWVVFFVFICGTHLVTGVTRYVTSCGLQQKSPTPMVFMTLAPILGNELHIFKDHVETALCFGVAHCQEGHLRVVAFVLGYLSLLATFVPLAFLVSDTTARRGLLRAHWPVLDADPPEEVVVVDPPLIEEGVVVGEHSDEDEDERLVVLGDVDLKSLQTFDLSGNISDLKYNDWVFPRVARVRKRTGPHGFDIGVIDGQEAICDYAKQTLPMTFANTPCLAKLEVLRGHAARFCEWLVRSLVKKLDMRSIVNSAIPAVTREKQIRALAGELPDGIIDVAFIFLFGGSPFMIAAIAVSAGKVFGIPAVREHILPRLIRTYGCSTAGRPPPVPSKHAAQVPLRPGLDDFGRRGKVSLARYWQRARRRRLAGAVGELRQGFLGSGE